ncbi:MAG: hypothetical protein H7A23_17255 [Leptospiraceae bacterium]|nr:hypothetical protein [Leptospiraceae bacterium]MCP5496296.1 hypothetical protein [Leptospiraceae bacterium]
MTHVEKLNEISKQLPEKFLLELVDFAEFLKWKVYNNTQTKIQTTFWESIQSFRATADFEVIGNVDDIFKDSRDKDTGREVIFL